VPAKWHRCDRRKTRIAQNDRTMRSDRVHQQLRKRIKMQLVTQTKFPQRGNCFRACMATLLSIDIDELPAFEEQSDNVWIPAKRWLIDRGLSIRNYHKDFPPDGYSIATGPSPRNPNIYHAVVALDGMIFFDPHPDRSGLASTERYWQIEKSESVDEEFDDDIRLCSYPEMSHQERYEFRKNNKPSLKFKIDTIFIKNIDNEPQSDELPENKPKIQIIPSSGNVYADMGFDNAEEMFEKAQVVVRIKEIVESLGGYEAALKYCYLDLTSICRGNFRKYTIDLLKQIEATLSQGIDPDPWGLN
jgi:hypothetical protein